MSDRQTPTRSQEEIQLHYATSALVQAALNLDEADELDEREVAMEELQGAAAIYRAAEKALVEAEG
jgi:hypothetical protein